MTSTNKVYFNYELGTKEADVVGTGDITNASNTGTGEPIFKDKTGSVLNFKSLASGQGVQFASNTDTAQADIDLNTFPSMLLIV